MRYVVVLSLILFLQGCGSLPHHTGQIPSDYNMQDNNRVNGGDLSEAAELITASGERQYYILGSSRPSLTVSFRDQGFSIFGNSYSAVRVNPGKRDLRFTFQYRDSSAIFDVDNFDFEPHTRYYAKYSTFNRSVRMWIEKDDGTVVYGVRPEEGQF